MTTWNRVAVCAVLSILVAGCSEREIARPVGSERNPRSSAVDVANLNADKMAHLRQYADGGCAAMRVDAKGVSRATVIKNKDLPFAIPAVQHDLKSGAGDGHIVQLRIQSSSPLRHRSRLL